MKFFALSLFFALYLTISLSQMLNNDSLENQIQLITKYSAQSFLGLKQDKACLGAKICYNGNNPS